MHPLQSLPSVFLGLLDKLRRALLVEPTVPLATQSGNYLNFPVLSMLGNPTLISKGCYLFFLWLLVNRKAEGEGRTFRPAPF